MVLVSLASFIPTYSKCCVLIPAEKCFSAELEQCYVGETCEIQHHSNATEGGTPNGLCVCLKNHKRNKEGYCMPMKPHPQLPTPAKVNSDKSSSSCKYIIHRT